MRGSGGKAGAPSPRILAVLAAIAFAGCREPTVAPPEEGGTSGEARAEITSPAEGDVFLEGEAVPLAVRATAADGSELAVASAAWSVDEDPSWAAAGAAATVTDLPVGALTLRVSVLAGTGDELADAVAITVEPAGGDTGGPLDYEGTIDGQVDYEGSYGSYADACPGWIAFTLDEAGVLDGAGSCRAFSEDWDFTLSGTVEGATVTGELAMTVKKTPIPTPFEGVLDADGHFSATFDTTHVPAEGESIRVYGTLDADPSGG